MLTLLSCFALAGCDSNGTGPSPLENHAAAPLAWTWGGPSIPEAGVTLDAASDTAYRRALYPMVQRVAREDPDQDLAALDPALEGAPGLDPLWAALTQVYARTDLAARDTVVERCRVRQGIGPATHLLWVQVDSAMPWVSAWKQERSTTGEPAIDSLLTKYAVAMDAYYDSIPHNPGSWVVLRSSDPLNMVGLGRLLEGVEGVDSTDASRGDVRPDFGILASADSGTVTLEYQIGFGDCLSGCLGHRRYAFRVDASGDVTYLGSSGDPLPDSSDAYNDGPYCWEG